ncbi:MAG: LysR family transcriptional regulator [Paludibacter sp.]|nr:LysR family transcriptional regulator [Paludibacter sp.]
MHEFSIAFNQKRIVSMNHFKHFYLDGTFTICREGEIFLGNLQIRLLKQVNKDGSILAAAKNLKMSYQHAWHLLDKVNQLAPLPIVIRQKGGKDGGGCVISNYGLKLISTFDAKELALKDFLASNNADLDSCFF